MGRKGLLIQFHVFILRKERDREIERGLSERREWKEDGGGGIGGGE